MTERDTPQTDADVIRGALGREPMNPTEALENPYRYAQEAHILRRYGIDQHPALALLAEKDAQIDAEIQESEIRRMERDEARAQVQPLAEALDALRRLMYPWAYPNQPDAIVSGYDVSVWYGIAKAATDSVQQLSAECDHQWILGICGWCGIQQPPGQMVEEGDRG